MGEYTDYLTHITNQYIIETYGETDMYALDHGHKLRESAREVGEQLDTATRETEERLSRVGQLMTHLNRYTQASVKLLPDYQSKMDGARAVVKTHEQVKTLLREIEKMLMDIAR